MDVAEIIAGMSRLAKCNMKGRILYISSRQRQKLTNAGLLNKAGNNWSELGLAVRKALMEMHDGS